MITLCFLSPPSEKTTIMNSEISRYTKLASRLMKNWGSTIGVYLVGATALGLYVADLQFINSKIPYYGKKFEEEDSSL